MQSEAAGMFNNPMSGAEGHAMLAATLAKMQNEHEASQEAAIQQHARQHGEPEAGASVVGGQSENNLQREGLSQSEQPLQKPKAHSWDSSRADPPGLSGDGPHHAPMQITGMHSGELFLSGAPILGSSEDTGHNG